MPCERASGSGEDDGHRQREWDAKLPEYYVEDFVVLARGARAVIPLSESCSFMSTLARELPNNEVRRNMCAHATRRSHR